MPAEHNLMVRCEVDTDIAPHPKCPHGPTLLFYYRDEGPEHGYYACSAHRDKKSCTFYLRSCEFKPEKHLARCWGESAAKYRIIRKLFLHSANEKQRHFCHTCNLPLLQTEMSQHAGHEVVGELSAQFMKDPTLFLRPLNNDKVHAQYFFDMKSLHFFQKCFHDLNISKVVCIGAPRLHTHLTNNNNSNSKRVESFLLDIDERFYCFFEDEQFAWFNMCNNYFFDKKQQRHFHAFLKCSCWERVVVFIDPPFGCRTEPIANTLRQMAKLFSEINELPHQPLPIFWIYPYFSAHYVQQLMPELQMCDYKVNYTNHLAYSTGVKGRKLGSPVRIFTNVPLERLLLPVAEQYKYCAQCQKYTALENRHCHKCHDCPSRNGSTYRHCDLCGICVKPYYVHCTHCRRCTQAQAHNCREYQALQHCWICLQQGHVERNCIAWQKHDKRPIRSDHSHTSHGQKKVITCLLCGGAGHNELHCKQRHTLLQEEIFLGKHELLFAT